MTDYSHNTSEAHKQQCEQGKLLRELKFRDAVGEGNAVQYCPDLNAWNGFFWIDSARGPETVAIDCRGELHFRSSEQIVDLSEIGFKKLNWQPELW